MRFPRASAVVVALSTFVAVTTVAALASQLMPSDRAGAVLPDGPITIQGQTSDATPPDESTPGGDEVPSAAPDDPGGSPDGSTGASATVVVPAPAETVESGPGPEPNTPPDSPGNSGNAPGHSGNPGIGGKPPDQGKP